MLVLSNQMKEKEMIMNLVYTALTVVVIVVVLRFMGVL